MKVVIEVHEGADVSRIERHVTNAKWGQEDSSLTPLQKANGIRDAADQMMELIAPTNPRIRDKQ